MKVLKNSPCIEHYIVSLLLVVFELNATQLKLISS